MIKLSMFKIEKL